VIAKLGTPVVRANELDERFAASRSLGRIGSVGKNSLIRRINGLVIRAVSVEIPSRMFPRPVAMAMIVGRFPRARGIADEFAI
jgi:hypothetical protein